ncbi:MAG: hypothetical protein RR209_01345 [Angelakisella sp.]
MKIENEAYRQAGRTEQAVKPTPAKAEEKAAQAGSVIQSKPNTDVIDFSGKRDEAIANNTYTPPKKLTTDQVSGIREMLAAQESQMLQSMAGNTTNQANSFLQSIGGVMNKVTQDTDAFWKQAGAIKPDNDLPPVATTPEGALAAISEGGAYSVKSVADRIFGMAESMAGDDPKLLEKMRTAVIKGFKEAGIDFKSSTGKGLPSISDDTFSEIMKRFDAKLESLGVKPEVKPGAREY